MFERGTLIVLFCVVVMTIGQVLFKKVAINYNKVGTVLDLTVLGYLVLAGVLYVISTGLWVWALRYVDLSRAYTFFALGFVFVPLLGVWMFGETLNLRLVIGMTLIVAGVILAGTS